MIYQPPSDLNVSVGRSAVLQCQTDLLHIHSDVFRWRRLTSTSPRRGEVIFQNFPLFISNSKKFAVQGRFNLIIRNATLKDEGVYICELVLQGLRYRANLKVQGKEIIWIFILSTVKCWKISQHFENKYAIQSWYYPESFIEMIYGNVWLWSHAKAFSIILECSNRDRSTNIYKPNRMAN